MAKPLSKHWCLWSILIRNNDKDKFLIRTWSKNLSVMETWVLPEERFPSIFIPSSNSDHSELPPMSVMKIRLLYRGGKKSCYVSHSHFQKTTSICIVRSILRGIWIGGDNSLTVWIHLPILPNVYWMYTILIPNEQV